MGNTMILSWYIGSYRVVVKVALKHRFQNYNNNNKYRTITRENIIIL